MVLGFRHHIVLGCRLFFFFFCFVRVYFGTLRSQRKIHTIYHVDHPQSPSLLITGIIVDAFSISPLVQQIVLALGRGKCVSCSRVASATVVPC